MDKRLLDILCCPVTRLPVRAANRGELDALNRAIGAGGLSNAGGIGVGETLSAALVTSDRTRIYPVVDDIPVLLGDEAILVERIAGFVAPGSDPREL